MSDTYVVMPIVVHEFVDCPVPEEELELPQELEQRCCLFRQRVPPDQLNSRVGVGTHHATYPRYTLSLNRNNPDLPFCGSITFIRSVSAKGDEGVSLGMRPFACTVRALWPCALLLSAAVLHNQRQGRGAL